MGSNGRSVLGMIATNFINSLRRKAIPATEVGKDHFGNTYFEISADPSKGRRNGERYFEPKIKNKYDQEIPAEWEAWLRGRRHLPPQLEEIQRNIQKLQQTLTKASDLDFEKSNIEKPVEFHTITDAKKKPFPKYEDYEVEPGKPKTER